MSPKTAVHSPNLIVTRLGIEAALRHADFGIRVESGRLFVRTTFGDIPVLIESVHDGGLRVELSIPFGVCPDPNADFYDFIAKENERDDGVRVEVDENSAVCVRWEGEFPDEVDCAQVVQGVALLGIARVETGKELRQRFFVRAVSGGDRGNGGLE